MKNAQGLLVTHGSHLTEWQQEMFLKMVDPVPDILVQGHGRRSGYTILMQAVEAALKDRDSRFLWDGSEIEAE